MSRFRAILGRWISLICCGAVASAIWAFVGGPVESLLGSAIDHLASIRSDLLASGVLIAAIAVCWPLGRRRWLAFFGLRHLGTYPPLWLAIATALLVITVHTGMTSSWQPVFDEVRAGWWLITAVPFWLWTASGALAVLGFVTSKLVTSSAPKKHSDGTDLEALVERIMDDREVSDPKDDWFYHNDVALRIVRRLTESDGESPTMAVVGPLGSGKSTIRRLVAHDLAEHPSVQMLDISLWPFDSAESAVAGILGAVVRSLGEHVNTLAVSGLSERYVTTIERVAGRWGTLARYLRGESRPEVILDGLAAIATAAGLKLVLWIEDMERFTGADRLPPEEAAIRAAERLGPILSLLYLLDRCDSISVVVGDTSLRSRLDIGKIARFVERPPRPTSKMVWREIAILRSACLAEEFIDPADDGHRKELTPPDDDTHFDIWAWHIRDTEPRVQVAIVLLLNTPRAFKSALRLTWDTWKQLRREIDFDSVLVASALRVAQPDVFALIDEHIDLFRHGFRDPVAGRDSDKSQHSVLAQLDTLLKQETERMRNAIKAVISFVFPAALRDYKSSDDDYVSCPQGLSVERHTDYWHRYLTLPAINERESDQAALRAIAAWKNGKESDLISRVADPELSQQIGTFVGQFKAAELCQLLIETAEVSGKNSARAWGDCVDAPGFISIWLMMLRRRPAVKLLADTICTVVNSHIEHHLPIVYAVIATFADEKRSSDSNLIDGVQRKQVGASLRETLVSRYGCGTGRRLLGALQDGSPWIVYYLCEFASDPATDNQPFDGWEGFAESILDVAEENPSVGMALTVPFYTTSEIETEYRTKEGTDVNQPVRDYVAMADEKKARQLFDFKRLVQLLVRTPPPDDLDRPMKLRYEAAQTMATEALGKSGSSESAGETDE